MTDYLRTSEITHGASINETDKCHRDCLDVKARTSRLRIKPGIEESELEQIGNGGSVPQQEAGRGRRAAQEEAHQFRQELRFKAEKQVKALIAEH